MISAVLMLSVAFAPSSEGVAERVHDAMREIMAAHEGRAVFSELHNRPDISDQERAYAERLYETFFALPADMAAAQRAKGRPPATTDIANDTGLTIGAVDLLLEIFATDPRLPRLLTLDPQTREVTSLDVPAIDAFVEARGGPVKVSDWLGQPLPDFSLVALDGAPLRGSDLRDGPSLIFMWQTHCPICRRVTPQIVELATRFQERGLRVVGLCSDDVTGLDVPAHERRQWLKEQAVPYPNAVLDAAAHALFGRQQIFPVFFLSDAEGQIVRFILNEQELATMETLVEQVLD
jgi:thiol-disulfide isomerase/thioredoxin